ncbi:type I polyketide synthase [Iningainema tapete]|uniref:Phenolphthiocerol/phthiocerol polyketide synthase subunit E n=1 Tax=Iningainema tapete BLCC-T55 TaxID=2748662 RepID=A0A8J7BYI3_9CYAN|nr:type I polyketide synthase [Iningainema tapete]MBD2775787.1 SDR family NAD(P)-dependent oxidoreductase [Iningainema tapete BLCC-T55]
MNETNGLEIAIIGMSGRLPGSKSIEDFWENLINGVQLISVFNERENLNLDREKNGRNQSSKKPLSGSVLDDVELFDASFFGFSPREAEIMDPQHRLFLECAWEALENAGYDSERETRPIGVYAGVGMGYYLYYNLFPHQELMQSIGGIQSLISVDKDYIPTRVSYKLNLTGPSVSVGTACSSSLVAVHLASQSLLSGECYMALAAGVAVKVPQNELTLAPGEIISPDGHCRAFDAKANGTLGGNGIGVVVLKRLEDAIADRDYIYAVIKGSAINNDGAAKIGYTAPSEDGQAKVIHAAQVMAEVAPETITYMEAHGTGTPLGDPIEIAAMTQAFRVSTEKKGYCAIGSVKTNVGHLDAAAGITGLIKTTLALHHKLLPPSINFEQPNPQIDFENSPFYVNSQLCEWKVNGIPRRAGVSSFGIGGTNAHVILEEQTPLVASLPSRPRQILVLSAKTHSALQTATANLVNHLKQHPEKNLADVAYTLQVGRRAFNYRQMVVVENREEAITVLELADPKRVISQFQESSDRSIVFMFSGQGSQYVNMARELYQTETTFQQECDRCCDLLLPHLGFDLRSCLYPIEETANTAQQLQQTAITQPALFVIEYALAKLWMSWGVLPQAMIGHSIGEYVAATLSGVFSLEDALSVVATRGKLMQQLPSGAMLAVSLSADDVETRYGASLQIAASNAPSLSVVSGSIEAVEQLEQQLAQKGVESRRLHTSHAFHSEMMDSIIEPFTEYLKTVNLNPPQIPFISNVTGTWIDTKQATNPSYWAQHLRRRVRFSEGITELLQDAKRIFLEVGPGRTLSSLVKRHTSGSVVLSSLRHPQEQQSDVAFLLNTLGRLWLAGVQVDWAGFYAQEQRARLPLPTYPFERQRYWIEPLQHQSASSHHLTLDKKLDITDWFYIPSWKRSVILQPSNVLQVKSIHLVFIDECGLGIELVKRLQEQGQEVITVTTGAEYTQLDPGAYTLNPQQPQDYDALLQVLAAQHKIPNKIVHLLSVTPEHTELALDSLDKAQQRGFYSLLFLAQAFGKHNWTDELEITVISNNLQQVTQDEALAPEKATLLGLLKTIPQEYPNISCRSIDVVFPSLGNWHQEKLVEQLLTEIVVPTSDQIVAYRGSNRWVQTFELIRLDEALETTPCLREAGVYLITGGLGGIGGVLAQHLAKTVRAKLVLTGRTTLPNRDEWSQWLANQDANDSISCKISQVLKLEALGAEVLVNNADVTNLEQMQVAIAHAQEQFGQINGVIHAAGVPGGGVIQRKTFKEAERIFAAKVRGTLVLDTIFKNEQLDFFILCSSLASILGGFGQVDYAGANAFLDAFAHYQKSTNGKFTTCINWDAWQEVGMGVAAAKQLEQTKEFSTDFLKHGLLPLEGVKVFRRILATKLPQVLVSTTDLSAKYNRKTHSILSSLLTGKQNDETKLNTHQRPHLETTYVAPSSEVESTIAQICQELLGIEQVGINDNFFDLGGNSLIGVRLISRLNQDFQVEIPIHSLFESPTVAELALIVEEAIIRDLQELAEEEGKKLVPTIPLA